METNNAQRRRLEGIVVSVKEHKTIHVSVAIVKMHPKYSKQYTVKKKYAVHDEHGKAQLGDKVVFEACRPISKTKSWTLVGIVK
jgi:small subunit ribosomal protein S17